MKTIKNIALAASLLAASATASFAATYIVNGTSYDVTTITGTYTDNAKLLESQDWWGDDTLATLLAGEVKGSLGYPNRNGEYAVFFAYSLPNPTQVNSKTWNVADRPGFVGSFTGSEVVFAIADATAPVPLPAGALLLLTGLGATAAIKRRAKSRA